MRLPRLTLVALSGLALSWTGGVTASDLPGSAAVDLFENLPTGPRPRAAVPGDEAIRARRQVRVRRESLQAPTSVSAPLRFNFFPGAEFTAITGRDETLTNGDRVLSGTLAGVDGSQFLMVVHGEEIVADVFVSPLESYQLRREPGTDGAPEVRRLDPVAMPPCGGIVRLPHQPARQARGFFTREVTPADPDPADAADTFDVLIAYTPAARVQLGGTAGIIEAQAQLAVQGLNDRLQSSQIHTRARLVHTMEVSYAETGGDLIADLTNLENAADALAAVHEARDAYAADLVSLFVAGPPAGTTGSFVIGLATFAVELDGSGQVQGIPEQGFTVVEPFYDVANTFAHEIGHNFGCQHDREHVVVNGVDYGPGLFPYSYGWRFDSAGHTYRTLMSYAPGSLIPLYSSPQVTFGYTFTGVAEEADNSRTINASAAAVANLRRVPAVSITAPLSRAVETPTTPGLFTVTRTGTTARPLTVRLRASFIGGAASFQPLPDQVTIPAGQRAVDIPVVPVDDDRHEDRRGAILEVLYGDGYRLVSPLTLDNQATVYLFDTQETVSITATRPTAMRDPPQNGGFRLTRTGSLEEPLTVYLRLHEISSPVSLYGLRKNYRFDPPLTRLDPPIIGESSASNYAVDIPAGSDSVDLTFIPDATAIDAVQIFGLDIVERDQYLAGQPSAVLTILDRPMEVTLPGLSIFADEPTASAVTGRAGRFVVTRSRDVASSPLVGVYISGSAAYDLDYTGNRGNNFSPTDSGSQDNIFIPAGQASFAIEIHPKLDPHAPTRTVRATVGISNNPVFTIDPRTATATVTILGAPVVTATVTGPEAHATSDLGPVNGEFTLRREGDLSQPLTVLYNVGGTAVAGNRCKALPGVATFPAGQDFVRVKVKPKGNAGGPGAKTNVKLTLQPGDGYLVGSEARAKVKVFGGG